MVWPFPRRASTTEARRPAQRIEAPREDDAELRLIEDVLSWVRRHLPGLSVRPAVDRAELHLGTAPPGVRSDAGAIVRFKRAKISGIDLYDPALRAPMNEMVKHFDRLQAWSFNGVITTKYDEADVDAAT